MSYDMLVRLLFHKKAAELSRGETPRARGPRGDNAWQRAALYSEVTGEPQYVAIADWSYSFLFLLSLSCPHGDHLWRTVCCDRYARATRKNSL